MKLKTITAFASQFNLSRATLLYYDRIGLLKPAGVSSAGYRLYSERERARMTRIATFRKAGLSLAAIQNILDGKNTTALEMALEQRLTALNGEITNLGAQQRLVIQLLGREGEYPRCRNINVEQWVAMLEEVGVDEAGRQRWHQAFERDAPDSHQAFLVSLGLKDEEISEIRSRSRDSE